MPPSTHDDAFLKLVDNLRELEVVIGPKAAPTVAAVRSGLHDALALRDRGDMAGALEAIRAAMQRLAALASDLDPSEGSMMNEIARRFTEALSAGLTGEAKQAINVMRHKAGDPKDEDGKW